MRSARPSEPGKHHSIVAALRRRIRDGIYPVGGLLPTVRTLAGAFAASVPTVSRALGDLVEEGFIATDGRRGTRVVAHPPHRHRFALVLPGRPDATGRYASLHWQALADAARDLGSDPATAIELFHAINEHPELAEHQRLIAAMRDGTVAGLVVCDPSRCAAWLDLHAARLPMIGPRLDPAHPERGTIQLRQGDFRLAALVRCQRAGRTRVAALLEASAHSLDDALRLRATAAARGLDIPAHRICAAPLTAPGWARPPISALLRGPREERPDALIVSDDNLLDDALAALDEAGIGHDEILVVAHANFPLPRKAAATRPVLRLGWDQREFLAIATAAIASWLDARRPPGEAVLPIRGEDGSFPVPLDQTSP
jgi:DNA-binding transcriptional regulator YhcF (GntR family)